jgi:cation transport ATPase
MTGTFENVKNSWGKAKKQRKHKQKKNNKKATHKKKRKKGGKKRKKKRKNKRKPIVCVCFTFCLLLFCCFRFSYLFQIL